MNIFDFFLSLTSYNSIYHNLVYLIYNQIQYMENTRQYVVIFLFFRFVAIHYQETYFNFTQILVSIFTYTKFILHALLYATEQRII